MVSIAALNSATSDQLVLGLSREDGERVLAALDFAGEAYAGKLCTSGQPAFDFAVGAAGTLALLNTDAATRIAGLLFELCLLDPAQGIAIEPKFGKEVADLVIPNTQYLETIDATSPDTPQLIYSNVSNLYQGLLTNWLEYADAHGDSRELGFYHVTKPTPFSGASPTSQPVTWFWGVYQTGASGGSPVDVTSAARGGRNFNVNFGGTGQTTAVGFIEKFREMNLTLVSGAQVGWSGVWEYVSAVDANGNPTAWKTLSLGKDGTAGLKQSGTITFDPPADWKTASVGGSSQLYFVRFRVTSGSGAEAPELKTIFGRDYVQANGGQTGVIPAFQLIVKAP
jgi:hypothetical protein